MKKRMKRIAAYLMATVMMLSCVMVEGTTVKAEEPYVVNPADYDIEYLLSNYQVYLSGDLTTTNTGHQVGALIVGGNATLGNSFGNVTIAPSYINHIEVFGQTNGYYTEIEQAYGDALTDVVYYSSKADSAYLTTQPKSFSKIPENSYIDFDAAYNAIKAESTSKANNAGTTIDVADVDADGYIYLDVSPTTKPRTYKITEEAFKKAVGIRFTGTNGSADVFRNTDTDTITGITGNPVEISVVGCDGTNEDITLNFNGSGTADSYSVGVEMDDGSGGYMAMGSKLKDKITGANDVQSGQVFAKGMSLIWNFPDAKNITSYFTSGHMVAPNAYVAVEGGNFEGGVIAASAYLNSEGHFYPYYEIGTATTSAPMEDMKVTKYVKKIWNEENDTYNNRPTSVTVHLYQDGVLVENSARELSQQNNWQDQWLNLDPNHEYTVVEDPVPGYTCEVVEDGGTFEVINTPETTSMTATKIWKNDGYDYNNTRQEVKAILLANGASINGVEAATLNAENNWSYTWDNLPTYKDKQKITYNVNETQIPPGYTHKETNQVDDTHLVFVNEYYTNIQPQGETTSLTVEKKWENYGNTQPESTTVFLVANDTISDPIELNASNNWTYKWENLPTKDTDGNNIIYSAKEVVVPNSYTATYSQVVDNKITITNTYTPVTSKTVKKIWNDSDSAVRPTSVNVQVYADGVPYGDAVALNSSNNWEYTWTDLPELKKNSAEKVVYTVKEVAVPDGYECTTEIVGDTVTLINTLKATEPTPVPQTGSITLTGTKVVEGIGAPSETYNFVVTENGAEVATGTANGAGAITFTKIQYDESNIGEHTYKVTETQGITDGMTYDTSSKTVKVTVSDDGSDTLKAIVNVGGSDDIEFTNTYDDPTPSTADAIFSKKAVSADGDELAGAQIKLTYDSGSNNLLGVTCISGGEDVTIVATAITWTSTTTAVKLSGLPEGEYTMTETGAPDGYKYATAISFKVDADGKIYQKKADDTYETTPTTTLTMVDEAKAGEITLEGTKVLEGDTAPFETYNFVVKEGDTQVATGEVDEEGAIAFTKITYGPEDIGPHTYKITETSGYTSGMDYDNTTKTVVVTVSDDGTDTLKAVVTSGDGTVVFTNTYTEPIPPLTAIGSFSKKAVSADGDELAGAQIKLTYDSGSNNLSGVTCVSGGDNVTIGATAITWTSTTTAVKLSGLPEGEYTMTETGAPAGYKYATAVSFRVGVDGKIYQRKADGTYETTTTHILTMVDEAKAGEITLTGKKTLAGDVAPSETYKFVVKEGDAQLATGEVEGAGDITFTKIVYGPENIGDHTYTITEIKGSTEGMTYDSTSKTVKVTVSDGGEDELKVTVDPVSSDAITFTNTYDNPTPNTATVTFSKTDAANTGELSGAKITLSTTDDIDLSNVTGSGTLDSKSEKSVTWTSGSSAMVLSGLPAGKYTMKETGAPLGYQYASDITFTITDEGKVKDANGNELTDNKITMVDEAIAKITKTVTKVWDDNNDAASKRPTSIQVQLKANGNDKGTTVTLDGSNSWSYTWTNLDKTDAQGTLIEYTVDEVSVPADYSKSVATDNDGNVTITNTYSATTPKKGSIYLPGTKVVEGTGAPSETYQFVVKEGTKQVATGSISGAGKFTFSKIEYGPTDIGEHTYTITETAGSTEGMTYDNTEVTVKVTVTETENALSATITSGKDAIKFTNTYTAPTPTVTTVDKTIKKVWADVNDTDKLRPESVELAILADGVKTGKTVTLNASNNWEAKVEKLPTTNASGTAIVYTIEETSVPAGYTVTYSSSGDVLTATNTHTPTSKDAPATGGLKITVVDEKTNDPVPGATVQVKYPDGTVETVKTDEKGQITYPQEPGIPTGDYEITVTEVPDGYTVTTGETGKATVVENKVAEHIAKIKTATGGLKITVVDEKTNDPVPGATVQVKYPDGTVETKTTDENGEINYPQDPGVPTGDYEVTVTEVPDGYTVTTGETAKVTVEKNAVAEHVAKVDSAEDSTSEEEEEEEDSDEITDDDSNEEQDSDATAKTGDNSPIKPVAVIMLLALVLFVVLLFIRRKSA